MKTAIRFLLALCLTAPLRAQSLRNEILLPQIGEFLTLKCDFHMHTVFSDGSVWPTVRVDEAWSEGLDVISITDHLEYTPNKDWVPVNHEAPFEIARVHAAQRGILLVKGTEITKSMPPGHFNALFIQQATPLFQEDPVQALREARKQGAFVIWNHPGWKAQSPDGPVWMDAHQKLFEEGLFQGIEVSNHNDWYPTVLGWARDKNLTVFSNSDMHGPVSQFLEEFKVARRPMTLVFAAQRTTESVHEALRQKRTIGWFRDNLFGSSALLEAFFAASVKATALHADDKTRWITVTNHSDVACSLDFTGTAGPRHLPPRQSLRLSLPPDRQHVDVIVTNMLIQADQPLTTRLAF